MKVICNKNTIEIKVSNQNIDYFDALKFMKSRVNNIISNEENELIWFLNHDSIYTKGTSSKDNEIVKKVDIPVIETNRGGKITYHGPGQRIVYFLINLNKRKKDIRGFVNLIQKSAINFLKDINIDSKTDSKRIGIWVTKVGKVNLKKEKKIGAIGLRLKKWTTYHGFSFNINPNLDYYNNILPCGLKDYDSTSLEDLGINVSQELFDKIYLKNILKELQHF